MKQNYNELPNGYLESINRGILAVRSFQGGISTRRATTVYSRVQIRRTGKPMTTKNGS